MKAWDVFDADIHLECDFTNPGQVRYGKHKVELPPDTRFAVPLTCPHLVSSTRPLPGLLAPRPAVDHPNHREAGSPPGPGPGLWCPLQCHSRPADNRPSAHRVHRPQHLVQVHPPLPALLPLLDRHSRLRPPVRADVPANRGPHLALSPNKIPAVSCTIQCQ